MGQLGDFINDISRVFLTIFRNFFLINTNASGYPTKISYQSSIWWILKKKFASGSTLSKQNVFATLWTFSLKRSKTTMFSMCFIIMSRYIKVKNKLINIF